MAYTFPQLKQIRDYIVSEYNIKEEQAARVIAFYNVGQNKDHDKIDLMMLGDLSPVPAALSALGIVSSVQATTTNENREEKPSADLAKKKEEKTAKTSAEKTHKKTAKRSKNATRNTADKTSDIQAPVSVLSSSLGASDISSDKIPTDNIKDRTKENTSPLQNIKPFDGDKKTTRNFIKEETKNIIPLVSGEVVEDSSDLPAGFADDVQQWLDDFATKYKLDLFKISGQQWRAACLYIGSLIQKSGVLLDKNKMKLQGGKIFNPYRVEKLLFIWEALTSLYKHTALVCDFIAFTGISTEWFYDSREVLSSRHVELRKKLQRIEESALSVGLVDGRENPTGKIFYSKARLGWRESVEIVHTSAAPSVGLAELPKLDIKADLG